MAQEIFKTYFETAQGNYLFDAYFNIDHESTLSITEHPVQTGANVADHAFMQPNILSFEIGMSDVMIDVTYGGFQSFSNDSASRSVNAYKILRQLQSDRIMINVYTKLWNYTNMLIESLSASDSNETAYALKANVTLKELLVATVTTVKISERPQKTDLTNEGEQKVQEASALASFLD
ncbi:phage baseplate protein [Candidatus Clostridium helianthi]|uniref:Phage baseplate protein n=1 Tax=Candidatus Clostridium helianthi TaxID=3381660 RepID=A0ABW8SAP2_9CLOT